MNFVGILLFSRFVASFVSFVDKHKLFFFTFSVVLLNKTDLVKEDEINKIKAAVKVLNPKANVATTLYSRVELKSVMQTGMFKMEDAEQSAGWLQSMKEELKTEAEEYGIGSFVYKAR